jgi:hypothetical protein
LIFLAAVSSPDVYSVTDFRISFDGNNTVVEHKNDVIYNGSDINNGIQQAINVINSSNDSIKVGASEISVGDGYYRVNRPIVLPPNTVLGGTGRDTIFDFSRSPNTNTFVLGENTSLSNIKLVGSITPQQDNTGQRMLISNNTIINNIELAALGFGIDVQRSSNVTITNIFCNFIYDSSDWSTCLQLGAQSYNINVSNFHISNSARGIVITEGAKNIYIRNGIIESIHNFAGTGNEPFSLDVHNRNTLTSENITFENITIKNSYSPAVKVTNRTLGQNELPANIRFSNINIENPISPWQIGGVNVSISDSSVKGSNYNIINLYSNTKNVTIDRFYVHDLHDDKYFVFNNLDQSRNINNLHVTNSTILVSPDKKSPVVYLGGVNQFTFTNNTVMNPPRNLFFLINVTEN